ncbi:hypothetical protein PYCCODRAFT_1132117 [Trametes coccinea BRFM310]|uniref:Uncharacterized protein n=1 Tax=Trametes coccinea (strain BRFM310) TaxID=1353009 RepID=A0A1Y2I9W1_TRAC3|nr:hypothetical protein PYCCODRAFT_1132117 [Trametes coccinea BRFM310]
MWMGALGYASARRLRSRPYCLGCCHRRGFASASAIASDEERQVDSVPVNMGEDMIWLFSGTLMAALMAMMAFIQSIRRPILGALSVSSRAWALSLPP